MEDNNLEQKGSETEEEITPVRLNKKQTGFVVIAILFVVIISIYCFRGCGISKTVKNEENQQPVTSETKIESQGSSNMGESKAEITENNVDLEGSDSRRDENSTSSKNSEKSEDVEKKIDESTKDEDSENKVDNKKNEKNMEDKEIGNTELIEVDEPELGASETTSAMVSSKTVYVLSDTSFVYAIDLLIVQGKDNYVSVPYFCPKKTYDAVSEGDSLKVSYQVDKSGIISISSISK